ncbi:MAG TPA: S53 family peptidase [Thermoplasmata archaeon]|nr:S53 family peptidase [Thermoplasmata archaeon]
MVFRAGRLFAFRPLLAALLALGMVASGTAGALAGGARSDAGFGPMAAATVSAVSSSSYYPAALSLPWADRSGFNATDLSTARSVGPATGIVTVELTLRPSSDRFFVPRPAGSPALSNAEIAAAYGVSPTEYASLEAYFVTQGLTIVGGSPVRLSMLVSGPAEKVGAAFGTELEQGWVGATPVRFPATVPILPSEYGDLVSAVSGLSNGSSRFVVPFAQSSAPPARPAQGSASAITPNAVHVIYDLNALYNYSGSTHFAQGEGIAVILWGSGYDPADLAAFFSQEYPAGFPQPKIADYPVDGAPSPSASAVNDPSNATQELTLDIEWSASEAPGATIDVVYAPDGPASDGYSPTDASMEAAINEAVTNIPGVGVISMSFGSDDGGDPSFQAALSQDFSLAAMRDITVLAASGDNGGTSKGPPQCGGSPAPQFPASSPWVLAVGGTAPVVTETAFGTVTGLASEPAWDGSGGGYSPDYSAPSWQLVGSAATLIRENGGHRGIPDVAGPAAENLFYYNGNIDYGSGTSFATPMWAGLIAEMDAVRGVPLGFITDRLYELGSVQVSSGADGLEDITQGSTCFTSASNGWDAATGWGSPRALPLYEHIAGTFVNVSISSSQGSVAPGGSVEIFVQVTNASSHRPIEALPVDFVMTGSFPGPCTGTLATASNASTDPSGSTNVSMTIPSCYLGSSVSVSATVDSGGYLGENSVSIGVNLLGLAGLIALSETFPYNVLLFATIMALAILVGLWIGRHRSRGAGAPPATVRPAAPPMARPFVPPPPPPPPPPVSAPAGGPTTGGFPPPTGGPSPPPPPPTSSRGGPAKPTPSEAPTGAPRSGSTTAPP